MKKTKPTTELETDDEVLREQAMTSGPVALSRWEMRPTAALEISWMQENDLTNFLRNDSKPLQRAAAFAIIHSENKAKTSSVVHDRQKFQAALDEWIDSNQPTAKEIAELNSLCLRRANEWYSCLSEGSGGKSAAGN